MLRYSALVAAAASLVAMAAALAEPDPAADYPNRPVKVIVSVPAGGGVDTVTRIFAARLQQRLGQPFVIENRGGAGARRRCRRRFRALEGRARHRRDAAARRRRGGRDGERSERPARHL